MKAASRPNDEAAVREKIAAMPEPRAMGERLHALIILRNAPAPAH